MKLKAAVEAQSNSRTMNEWVKIAEKEFKSDCRRAFFKIEAHKIVFTADFVVAIFVDLSAQIEIPSRLELQLELL